jgi:mannose-6-phosphate isomerase
MLYPLTFHPLYKERVWGGRNIERLYGKPLPQGKLIGESWEISDRPGDASVIANGPLAGKDLRWLMEHHPAEVLGSAKAPGGTFPLLVKILDACDKLSLQVHPPAAVAARLGGEPKTEMWYVASAEPGAVLYVGLRAGVTREEFERKLQCGNVAECFHKVPVGAGDTMFLPSGRVHGIGAGLVIFEIQQNSDTTYRVFDWNRLGLDGKPRDLHVPQSLASIRFDDFEPEVMHGCPEAGAALTRRLLVSDPLFRVEMVLAGTRPEALTLASGRPRIICMVEGQLEASGQPGSATVGRGGFCLLPASVESILTLTPGCTFLLVQTGE